jgi:hypothetical protein
MPFFFLFPLLKGQVPDKKGDFGTIVCKAMAHHHLPRLPPQIA